MGGLFYLKFRQSVNAFRQLKEKKAKLFATLATTIGLLAFLFTSILVKAEPAAEAKYGRLYLVLVLLSLMTAMGSWLVGIKQGNMIFSQADAHFLFTSPYRPQTLLLYTSLNQLQATILGSLFFVYQINNFRRIGITSWQFLLSLAVYIYVSYLNQCIGLLFYCLSYDSAQKKRLFRIISYCFGGAVVLTFGAYAYFSGAIIEGNFIVWWPLKLIPVIGWTLGTAHWIVEGFSLLNLVSSLLLLASPFLVLWWVYRLPVDFYEDAMNLVDRQVEAASSRSKSEDARKASDKIKVKEHGLRAGRGESTIFFRQWLEYRRQRPRLVGFRTYLFFILAGLMVFIDYKQLLTHPEWWPLIILATYFLLIKLGQNISNPLLTEISQQNFFLLPGRPWLKTAYAGVLPAFILFIDLLPAWLLLLAFGVLPLWFCLPILVFLLSALLAGNSAEIWVFRIFAADQSVFTTITGLVLDLLCALPGLFFLFLSAFFFVQGHHSLLAIAFLCLASLANFLVFGLGLLTNKKDLGI